MKSYNKGKKVVISGYYGFDNFGDEAILGVLVKKLKELGAQIRVFSKNPIKTGKTFEVNSTLNFCPGKVIFNIAKSDILISGGGSLLQDVTSIKSLIYYLIIINIALFFRKKVIIFAQGIGPITSRIGRFLTQNALKKCSLVTVRDEKSLALLKSWGIEAELVCDPLFDLKMVESAPSNVVGVQLRKFKTLKEKLLVKLANEINLNFADKEIEIYSFQDSLDLAVCEKFEKILKHINPEIKTKILSKQSFDSVLAGISRLDYMVAMRFHANLVALKYGTKTLAICYDEKVEKLAVEAGIPYLSMDATENFAEKFEQLKNLDEKKLREYSNSKHFDWSKIEAVIEK